MRKIMILICIIGLFFSIPTGFGYHNLTDQNHDFIVSQHGWIDTIDDVTVLHLCGSHYEMGFQHGRLLQQEVQENLRAFLAASVLTKNELLEIWYQMEPHVPSDYIDEMQGLADGANVTFEDVAAAYMDIVWGDRGCFGFAAWGPATTDGALYHARSFDLPFNIYDEASGKYVHENTVLIVRHPSVGIDSVAISIAGSMHGGGGINAEGISLGQQVCWASDQTYEGIPGMIRVQMVLDSADSLDEAIQILTSNKTLGWNFIVSDYKQNVACVVEVSGNYSYVGMYNTSTEENDPFWMLDHIVRRTNFFIDPTIADTQRRLYDPSGFKGLINLFLTGEVFWAIYQSYRVISTDLENSWGALDLNSSLALLRQGYIGDTDLLLKLVIFLAEGTSFNQAWNQWVYCPESQELVVCFASHDKIAPYNLVHYFRTDALFNAAPP